MYYQFMHISDFSNEIMKLLKKQKYTLRENIHVKYKICLINSINFESFILGLCALLAHTFLLEGILSLQKVFILSPDANVLFGNCFSNESVSYYSVNIWFRTRFTYGTRTFKRARIVKMGTAYDRIVINVFRSTSNLVFWEISSVPPGMNLFSVSVNFSESINIWNRKTILNSTFFSLIFFNKFCKN